MVLDHTSIIPLAARSRGQAFVPLAQRGNLQYFVCRAVRYSIGHAVPGEVPGSYASVSDKREIGSGETLRARETERGVARDK